MSSISLIEPVLQQHGSDYIDLPTGAQALEHRPIIKVLDISPLPKVEGVSIRKASKSKGKTAILTASPYRKDLEARKRLSEEKITANGG